MELGVTQCTGSARPGVNDV